uniref:Paraoxonase n=1 Tax=Callithrix jacchus TaxID=9483 RepID=A0A5F4W277_CALJA
MGTDTDIHKSIWAAHSEVGQEGQETGSCAPNLGEDELKLFSSIIFALPVSWEQFSVTSHLALQKSRVRALNWGSPPFPAPRAAGRGGAGLLGVLQQHPGRSPECWGAEGLRRRRAGPSGPHPVDEAELQQRPRELSEPRVAARHPETMGKLVALVLLGVGLSLVGERFLEFRERSNASREVESIEPENCHLIEEIENGSEDIDILPSGLAFISSGLKYPGLPNFAPNEPGKIFLIDLNEQKPRVQALEISGGFDKELFNPHGISIFIDKVCTWLIQTQTEEVSLLNLCRLLSVNDIVVFGPEQFYATRDHYFTNSFLLLFEMILDLRWTYVLFYSPREVKVVATGFSSANGITISADQKYVYVADVTAKNIHVMEKHDNWDLTQLKVIHLGTLVDNLSVDPATGDILAGCHPNLMKLLLYNPDDPPGSEVLRIQNIMSEKPRVSTVYANNGSVLQGTSVASMYHGKILIGTVFHKTLYCEL